MSLRRRCHRFVEKHLRAWELLLALFAAGSVYVGVRSTELGEPEYLTNIEWVLTGLFAVEYAFRLWIAPSRFGYFKSALIDLVSIFPPVRGVRLLRLVRLLRVAENIGAALETTAMGRRAIALSRIAILWVSVVGIAAVGLYSAELGQNPSIQSGFDALWWAVVTTTVGFGDIAPVTAEGRLAAALLMVLGVGFFSFFVATITASLAADAPGKKGGQSAGTTLNAKLADLDLAIAAKRITRAEHKRLRARLLARF
jgi:voltage-gated potassium channel